MNQPIRRYLVVRVGLLSESRHGKSVNGNHSNIEFAESTSKDRVTDETTAIGQIYNEELSRTNLSEAALATAHTAREASENEISHLSSESDGFSS